MKKIIILLILVVLVIFGFMFFGENEAEAPVNETDGPAQNEPVDAEPVENPDTSTSSPADPGAGGGGDKSGEGDGTIAESCEANDGTWLPKHGECEYVSEQWCTDRGGTFEACASACRHDPDAEICTEQCVPVCEVQS